jgi:hypothetical protein
MFSIEDIKKSVIRGMANAWFIIFGIGIGRSWSISDIVIIIIEIGSGEQVVIESVCRMSVIWW